MKAVILAGGKGSRLQPLTMKLPKPLVPLLNKPVMEYSIELLKKHGIKDIIITLQYLGDKIRDYFRDGRHWGVNITYVYEDLPLGTAGSVKNAEHLLEEPFLVISGDALTDLNLMDGVEYHHHNHSLLTIFMKEVKNPTQFGIMVTDDHGHITNFLEKPQKHEIFSNVVNTGVYVIDPFMLCMMEKGKRYDFSTDIFPKLIKDGKCLLGYHATGYWKDIGSHEDYRQAQYDMLDKKVCVHIGAEEILPNLWIGSNVQMENNVTINTPAFIGNDTYLGDEVVIGKYTIIGKSSRIQNGCKISRSILWDDVNIYSTNKSSIKNVTVAPKHQISEGYKVGVSLKIKNKKNISPVEAG
ncbi:sugar phosphate nucleotidyltransferase [Sutcliffiella rhizosphaerae]|uniref:UTP--glucose-1-phosphate uridylyltransferase n=1 Tax=Sutcliffiella rhizosphaerae TaxID=2880967 RepID=A0ABM8YHD5_9BACI|nr:NDP-sugar synthase [Sutcliffiella rhizosphaerae]CAG9619307.1 UTP--glucose-1-phosphate uridylyltransferase [Sutcliffiella rhizosphaerae]